MIEQDVRPQISARSHAHSLSPSLTHSCTSDSTLSRGPLVNVHNVEQEEQEGLLCHAAASGLSKTSTAGGLLAKIPLSDMSFCFFFLFFCACVCVCVCVCTRSCVMSTVHIHLQPIRCLLSSPLRLLQPFPAIPSSVLMYSIICTLSWLYVQFGFFFYAVNIKG